MFVSARSAQFLNTPIANQIMRTQNSRGSALIAIETSKFLVPLTKDQKTGFVAKELSFCDSHPNWERMKGIV